MVKGGSSSRSSMVIDAPHSSHGVYNDPDDHNSIPPKLRSNGRRQYKGVRMRSWGSWVSEIRAPNQKTRIWLGSYSTPEAAARAYDAALLCLKGSSANLNFPTSTPPHHLPTTQLMSPKSIQRAAAAAAAAANATDAFSHPQITPLPHSSPSLPPPSPPSDVTNDDILMMSSQDSMASLMEEERCNKHDPSEPSIDFEAFFHSPKCMDYMLNPCSFFTPSSQVDELDEEGDINLWSFC